VNWVDLIILLAVIAAAVHGLLLGGAVQLLSFGGLAVGLVAGGALAAVVARLGGDPLTKALFALLAVFGLALLGGAFGRELGVRLWGRLRRRKLAWFDAAIGALLAGAATLTAAWLIGGMISNAPIRGLASEIQHSAVLRGLGSILPPAPSVFSRLQRLIDATGLPQVFAQLEPQPAGRLPLPTDPTVRAAVARAGPSTVKIIGGACGAIQEGSGFVAGAGLVVTNAHVVAGVDHPTVIDHRGTHSTTPVLFDPDLDIAVLRVGALDDPALVLLPGGVPRGTTGAVLGYPGNGPFDAEPAVVLTRLDAVGRNIYGRGLVTRSVYEIQSLVRPGNSGGPLVRPDGTVAGVVFSRSTLNDDIGYTLTSDEVAADLGTARSRGGPVTTGPCTAG
jgi:S1-C subfamily serine protease